MIWWPFLILEEVFYVLISCMWMIVLTPFFPVILSRNTLVVIEGNLAIGMKF